MGDVHSYPPSIERFREMFPEFETKLYTLTENAKNSSSKFGPTQTADIRFIFVKAGRLPPAIVDGLTRVKNEFQRNGIRQHIYNIRPHDVQTYSPEDFMRAGPFGVVWYQRSLLDEGDRVEVLDADQRAPGGRARQMPVREGFLIGHDALAALGPDSTTSGTASEVDSNYIEALRNRHRKPEVGDQSWIATLLNIESMVTADYRRLAGGKLEDYRIEFTIQPETHWITIRGAGLVHIGVINDGFGCFRGKDALGRRNRLLKPRVYALEVKKQFTIAYGRWAAEILDIFMDRCKYAGVDFDSPASFRLLSEERRTVVLQSLQGYFHSWVWATISEEWIAAMLVIRAGVVARTRFPAPDNQAEEDEEERASGGDNRQDEMSEAGDHEVEEFDTDESMGDASPGPAPQLSQADQALNATFVTVYHTDPIYVNEVDGLYNAVAQVRAWTDFLEGVFHDLNKDMCVV